MESTKLNMPDTPNYDAAKANSEAIIKARITSGQFPNAQQLAQIKETELNLAAVEFVNKNPQKAQDLAQTDPRLKAAIEKTNPQKAATEEEMSAPLGSLLVESVPETPLSPPPPVSEEKLESKTQNPKPRSKSSKMMVVAILILFMVAAISGTFYFRSQSQLNLLKNNPNEISKQTTKEILDKVSKLIILPTDEEPTIATVTDLEKLKNQPFFAKAQIGDKVLIYQNNKKAIIYRPSSNQIVDVAPIDNQNSSSQSPSPLPSPSPSPSPKIVSSPTPQATSSAKTTK